MAQALGIFKARYTVSREDKRCIGFSKEHSLQRRLELEHDMVCM